MTLSRIRGSSLFPIVIRLTATLPPDGPMHARSNGIVRASASGRCDEKLRLRGAWGASSQVALSAGGRDYSFTTYRAELMPEVWFLLYFRSRPLRFPVFAGDWHGETPRRWALPGVTHADCRFFIVIKQLTMVLIPVF